MEHLINSFIVEGYLTSDVELTRDGNKKIAIAKFYLLNPRKRGKNKYENTFYIVVYGKKAEHCAQHLRQGKKCLVTGELSLWYKSDKNGNKETGATVTASDVYFEEIDT